MTEIAWIASYPKAGNTWLRFMLTAYLNDGPVTSIDQLQTAVPDLHKMLGGGETLPVGDGADRLLAKTHFLPDVGLMQLYREQTAKAVYLIRNPRDVMLSAMRHMGIPRTDLASCRRFAEDFIANEGHSFWRDHFGQGSWTTNVRSWTDRDTIRTHFPNIEVLPVKYEDMRADPAGWLRRILEFLDLGRPLGDDVIDKAVANSTFEVMRDLERRSALDAPGFSPFGGQGEFVGKGLHNQSLDFIGPDVEAAYRRRAEGGGDFAACLREFGYERG
ncbi:sulfotransferase [Actinomadura sp. NBRC 104425]|uniref:sulfotransferase domain-containing protein n=1 Tax=Actinomadura sp. NBRC 104425 TaxID=3032204 RepID=UPI0024A0E9B5|nr:sulfotransferase domain-containing protein [Actinomadura sp. NBRC 104425]GLZ12886.1 sulfotransferase [Actinomadura sp. NBRC 104425]